MNPNLEVVVCGHGVWTAHDNSGTLTRFTAGSLEEAQKKSVEISQKTISIWPWGRVTSLEMPSNPNPNVVRITTAIGVGNCISMSGDLQGRDIYKWQIVVRPITGEHTTVEAYGSEAMVKKLGEALLVDSMLGSPVP